jgi:putative ABC transport system permease protein
LVTGEADRVWTVIRYRWLQALVVVSLAALVTACAVFAPLYDRAIQQATVATTLHDAPVQLSGLSITSTGDSNAAALTTQELRRLVPRALHGFFNSGVAGTTVRMTGTAAKHGASTLGPLMWRQGMCAHVRFVSGRCPGRLDEVAVSRADARHFGWRVGSRIRMREVIIDPTVHSSAADPHPRMRVVGVYRVRRGPYWYGAAPVGRSGTVDQDTGAPQVDGWLTARSTVDGSVGAKWVDPVNDVDLPLDEAVVGIDQVLRIGPVVERVVAEPYTSTDYSGYSPPTVGAYSGLPDIARAAAQGRAQARVTVPLLMVQLALLAAVVLWLVLGAATEQRRPEVAVARLRGRGVGGARRLLLGELGSLVLLGVPLGVLAALGLSWLARHVFLPLTPPFELGRGFVVAVVAVLVVLALVTVMSVRQMAREPVSALLRRVPARRTTWAVGALDAMLVTACGTAVVAFVTGGLHGPLALAAPALLALLVGVVLAHLLVPVAAGAGRRLLARGRVTAGVSALHLARRPATRRVVTIVTVATALLVFSADALAVGDRNREYAADQEVGAPLVATVDGTDVAGVQAALHDVDPHGRSVTPVLRLDPPDQTSTSTQAVVPSRFSRIALLPGQSASSIPWGRLRPPAVRPIRLVGRWLSLSLASHMSATGSHRGASTLRLSLRLVGADHEEQLRTAAEPPYGQRSRHRVRIDIPCVTGCALAGLRLDTDPLQPAEGRLELSAVTTSSGQHLALGPARHWRATGTQTVGSMTPTGSQTSSRPAGLRVVFFATGAGPVVMSHASVPRRLPALVAGPLPPGSGGDRFAGVGLDGVDRAMVRAGTLPRAPGAPANTAVVNLQVLQRDGATPDPTVNLQVWFARDDPALLARVTRALHAHGLSVTTTSSVAAARHRLDRSAAAWSLQLALLVGLAGLLVAALVLVVVAATTWRLRSRDFAALRMSGLSRTQISLVAAGEQVPVVALAVLVGAVCGLLGAHFAMPTVPLFATAPTVSTLDLGTAWTAALTAAALALLVLSAVGWAAAWALAGRADLTRVRDSL